MVESVMVPAPVFTIPAEVQVVSGEPTESFRPAETVRSALASPVTSATANTVPSLRFQKALSASPVIVDPAAALPPTVTVPGSQPPP